MSCPILEFDPTPKAFIEPSKVIRPRDVPEHCVISFFAEVIEKVAREYQARVLVENRWEDGTIELPQRQKKSRIRSLTDRPSVDDGT